MPGGSGSFRTRIAAGGVGHDGGELDEGGAGTEVRIRRACRAEALCEGERLCGVGPCASAPSNNETPRVARVIAG